jgi:hypothetical protein
MVLSIILQVIYEIYNDMNLGNYPNYSVFIFSINEVSLHIIREIKGLLLHVKSFLSLPKYDGN